jgi:hypothetical protein
MTERQDLNPELQDMIAEILLMKDGPSYYGLPGSGKLSEARDAIRAAASALILEINDAGYKLVPSEPAQTGALDPVE